MNSVDVASASSYNAPVANTVPPMPEEAAGGVSLVFGAAASGDGVRPLHIDTANLPATEPGGKVESSSPAPQEPEIPSISIIVSNMQLPQARDGVDLALLVIEAQVDGLPLPVCAWCLCLLARASGRRHKSLL